MSCSKCNQCRGIELEFDNKLAGKELEKYRSEGPIPNTRTLIDALVKEGISGMTLLDIGGGIGAIQHELLKAGVSSCIDIEASQAYINAVKEEAKLQGNEDRITHLHGDFVDLVDNIHQCDIVTLDRVICCYHDVRRLVEKSAELAKVLYAVIYPLNSWKTRFAGALENLSHRLHRSPFRFFVHPPELIEEIVSREGFERRFNEEKGIWRIAVYKRVHP